MTTTCTTTHQTSINVYIVKNTEIVQCSSEQKKSNSSSITVHCKPHCIMSVLDKEMFTISLYIFNYYYKLAP